MGNSYQPVVQTELELHSNDDDNVWKTSTSDPLVHYTLMPPQASKKRKVPRWCFQFWDRYINNGWRGEMLRIAVFSTFLWLVNIVVYVVLFTKSNRKHGSGVLKNGFCAGIETTNTIIHMALNIMTSLMLAASTFAMDSLCCPTREEVDMAHSKGQSLSIGGLSMKNFRFISRSRSILWVLLWITSVPLHLFFNAVFYTSSKSYQYSVAVVKQDFLNNAAWTPTENNSAPVKFAGLGGYVDRFDFEIPDNNTILTLLSESREPDAYKKFMLLNSDKCMSMYSNGFLDVASDVIVVTTSVSNETSDPLIWTRYPQRALSRNGREANKDPYNWICYDDLKKQNTTSTRLDKDENYHYCTNKVIKQITNHLGLWTVYGEPVDHCIYRPQKQQCSLLFNSWMMLAVLVCGFFKTVIIVWTCIRHSRSDTLRTFGDAVSSFLEKKDETTKGLALRSSKNLVRIENQAFEPQKYTGHQQRWWRSVGKQHFWGVIFLTLLYAVVIGVLLWYAIKNAFGTAFAFPLGKTNIQALAQFQADDAGSSGIVSNQLMANIPQVFFSILYMAYNALYSKIHIAVEFDEHSKKAMGLRVSARPRGSQLASHFFHLPAHWGLTIMSTSSALHWLTSQGLYPVRVDGINNEGTVDVHDQLSRLGYNSRAIAALAGVLLMIAIITVCFGLGRKFDVSLGEINNSLIISAACHPPEGWNQDGQMSTMELSWGDVPADEKQRNEGVRHCSFAPVPPKSLIVDTYYS